MYTGKIRIASAEPRRKRTPGNGLGKKPVPMVRGVEEQKLREGGALLLALAGRGQTWKYGGGK
jgi:hypothetical protein